MRAALSADTDLFPSVTVGDSCYSYKNYLASLADLKDLAQSMLTHMPPATHFIDAPAQDGTEVRPTTQLLLDRTQGSLPLTATRVVFLYGNAGTGKTSALRELTRQQAERYLRGQATSLFLYLDAQGKGLTQLEDVMARALQDLRARFTYHSVAALTRRKCVVPIVDGFDELIGPSSAREAFANLSMFLAQLDCEGSVVASSRSSFIDYNTLHERAAEIATAQNLAYEILPIEVRGWPDDSISEYCASRETAAGLKEKVEALLQTSAHRLVRKPFYLSQICEIFEQGGSIDSEQDLTEQIVDAALRREASKLKDSRGGILLSPSQHREFCEVLADEMWSQGAPELDLSSVRIMAELFADRLHLPPKDSKLFVDRSIAHGLLQVETHGASERRSFEHELFRFEFQSSVLGKHLKGDRVASATYVQRGEVPVEVVQRMPQVCKFSDEQVLQAIELLGEFNAKYPRSQYVAVNVGALMAALLAGRNLGGSLGQLRGIYIRLASLDGLRAEGVTMEGCVLERVSLLGATLASSRFPNTQFINCIVDENTRFDRSTFDLTQWSALSVADGDSRSPEIYDPAKIAEVLHRLGANVTGGVLSGDQVARQDSASEQLLERLLRHFRTHYYLAPDEPWFTNNLDGDRDWPALKQLLIQHGLLTTVRIDKSGKPMEFMRLTVPPDVILRSRNEGPGANRLAVELWQDLLN